MPSKGKGWGQLGLKSEGHGSFFELQGSEMSENISLKMGVKFAVSLSIWVRIYVEFCLAIYKW